MVHLLLVLYGLKKVFYFKERNDIIYNYYIIIYKKCDFSFEIINSFTSEKLAAYIYIQQQIRQKKLKSKNTPKKVKVGLDSLTVLQGVL